MRKFGLIGKTLKHSFSKNYFGEKFEKEGIQGCEYDLYELPDISHFPNLIKDLSPELIGLNVTIPYKLEVMQYLDDMDEHAKAIQAVNTIKVSPDGKLTGYNSDYYGFKNSLLEWDLAGKSALVLGTGGASKAITKALEDLSIPYQMVSRKDSGKILSYEEINARSEVLSNNLLLINTTPLGTYPNVEEKPDLPYEKLTSDHLLFDLVYNPEITAFMQEGLNVGAKTKNGYAMLVGQAEKSWEIWNESNSGN